ncbi:hypothetical protein B7494_g1975 [Chlorociboria aeruginascens]|nr:hypothetical protein B7494_g1975 [Chlorociboria aeruginascens]
MPNPRPLTLRIPHPSSRQPPAPPSPLALRTRSKSHVSQGGHRPSIPSLQIPTSISDLPESTISQSKTTPNPTAPRFTLFPLLPPELRLQIWGLSLPSARVHEIYPHPNYGNTNLLLTNAPSPPALLHACPESRALALEHYTQFSYTPPSPTTAASSEFAPSSPCGIRGFYFRPSTDILFLNRVSAHMLRIGLSLTDSKYTLPIPLLQHACHVVLDFEDILFGILMGGEGEGEGQKRIATLFPRLRSLNVVYDMNLFGQRELKDLLWPGVDTQIVEAGLRERTGVAKEWAGWKEGDRARGRGR